MTSNETPAGSGVSKKDRRIESKKRKVAAFLRLANEVETVEAHLQDSDDETKSKKPKIPENFINETTSKASKIAADFVSQEPDKTEENTSTAKKNEISREELLRIRQALRARQKASMSKPKLFLTLDDLASQYGSMLNKENPVNELPPLFMMDVQHLLLNAIQNNVSQFRPRWCRLLRAGKISSVIVVVLDGVGSDDYNNYPECFSNIKKSFEMSVDMVAPDEYGCSVADEVLFVPSLTKKSTPKSKSREELANILLAPTTAPVISDKPLQSQPVELTPEGLPVTDKFPRTQLLLSTYQMVLEGYPMPNFKTNTNFQFTKDSYGKVTNHSPMFAVDCEMCLTSARTNELTRVSVVNEQLETVYDTFVKPFHRIVDYLTKYSGVTKEILDPVKTRLPDVQKHLKKILPDDAILCGQSLNGDLNAIQIFHPYVIDTSVIFNLSGSRTIKPGLKRLTAHFLGREIQASREGHSSVEDAAATMELVQLKLANSITFGDCVMGGAMFPVEGEVHQPEDKQILEDVREPEPDDNKTPDTSTDLSPSQIIARKRTFFCRESKNPSQSIFKIIHEMKKTAALVEVQSVIDAHKDSKDIVTMETDCDRTSKSLSKSYVEYHDFVYTCFPSYKNEISHRSVTEDEKKKILGRMDKRLGKVLKHVRTNSLVTVILSGQSTSEPCQSAKTFIKIV